MAIEAEALRALSEALYQPLRDQTYFQRQPASVVRRQAAFLAQAVLASSSLIHRSALAEDTARAAEGAITLAELRKASDAATQGEWIAVKAGFITPKDDDRVGAAIADGIGNSEKWPANRDFILKAVKFARRMLADATPNKEAAR